MCGVSVQVSACSGALKWFRVCRDIWRRSLPSFAAAARISQMSVRIWCTSWSLVGRGYCRGWLRPMRRRTLCTAWYPQVSGCCGLAGGSFRELGPASTCVWVVATAQIQGLAPVDDSLGQAEHGKSQVVPCPPGGDLGQGAGCGLVLRLEDAPEDLLWGDGLPYAPGGSPWGQHGVGPLITHCGPEHAAADNT